MHHQMLRLSNTTAASSSSSNINAIVQPSPWRDKFRHFRHMQQQSKKHLQIATTKHWYELRNKPKWYEHGISMQMGGGANNNGWSNNVSNTPTNMGHHQQQALQQQSWRQKGVIMRQGKRMGKNSSNRMYSLRLISKNSKTESKPT